ncbi:unnamed protein product [Natator depressus]
MWSRRNYYKDLSTQGMDWNSSHGLSCSGIAPLAPEVEEAEPERAQPSAGSPAVAVTLIMLIWGSQAFPCLLPAEKAALNKHCGWRGHAELPQGSPWHGADISRANRRRLRLGKVRLQKTVPVFTQSWEQRSEAEMVPTAGGDTAVSVLIVQKMAEESAEVTSDTSRGVNVSMLPGHGPVAERRGDVDFSLKCIKDKRIPITVTVVITALIITIIALAAKKTPPCPRCPPHVTAACPDGWVGYQGNCYFFSETEGNWSTSQSHCSSLNASLASIESLTELNFMLRYRGIPYCWIGLQREQGQGQPWKWTNGTIFNNLFPVRGEGQCAYLNEHGVSSSRCYSERHFICKQPDECSRRKPSAAGGDTMAKIT